MFLFPTILYEILISILTMFTLSGLFWCQLHGDLREREFSLMLPPPAVLLHGPPPTSGSFQESLGC